MHGHESESGTSEGRRRPLTWRRALLAVLALALLAFTAGSANAATTPPLLWQSPPDGVPGGGAGQLDTPEGVATDQVSGHVYVAERENHRVSEFDAWGTFVKAWGWGVRNGAAELQTCGPGAEVPTPNCLPGLAGGGAGQFAEDLAGGIAVDTSGDVYVGDMRNRRVEKFDPNGGVGGKEAEFLLMFGGEVDKGPNHPGNLCTAAFIAEGDACGAGTPGSGPGQFERLFYFGRYMAIGPGGQVFVGDNGGHVQVFTPGGSFVSTITLEDQASAPTISSLVVDGTGALYVKFSGKDNLYKFDESGAALLTIAVELSVESPLALDSAGNLYAVAAKLLFNNSRTPPEIVEFSPSGTPIVSPGEGFGTPPAEGIVLGGLATNVVTAAGGNDIYVAEAAGAGLHASLSAYGPPPDKWAPPLRPPRIESQYALSVGTDSATVGAQINPVFWADTRYYVEWGVGKCSEGGCTQQRPAAPGSELGAGIVNAGAPTKALLLSSLQPSTTYHYRFVAESTGSGGAPVRGIGGEVSSDGAEASFTTPAIAPPPPLDPCPNAPFRGGPARRLPDCRAYEMVSPVDKNGSDITALINIASISTAIDQSAADGEKLTYTTSQGFGDSVGTPYASQYIASRGEEGWQSHAISPPQGLSPVEPGHRIENEFRAFTADLCGSALQHLSDPPLAVGAVEGFVNLYRRQNCGPGAESYEALTTTKPTVSSPLTYEPEVQGLSADGRCTVFSAFDKLTPDAATTVSGPGLPQLPQVYESCGGQLRLVSVLPSGVAHPGGSSAGTGLGAGFRSDTVARAVSSDGSRVYWTATPVDPTTEPTKLLLRLNATAEQSQVSAGKCTEAEKACTVKVSELAGSGLPHFWSASPDGSRALFSIREAGDIGQGGTGQLFEFELVGGKGKATLIASQVSGVLGASEDAGRAYFVSRALLSSAANSEGDVPVAGRENLYLFDASQSGDDRFRFIATLASSDVTPSETISLTPTNLEPFKKTSRVSADGAAVVFASRASLTGYDNIDSQSGAADAEVYGYRLGADQLNCLSCNPTGQRPAGRIVKVVGQSFPSNWAAAQLPTYVTDLYGSRVLAEGGSRVFFNSYEALLGADTNGRADVYEWEEAGTGDCSQNAPAYSPPNGGCLSLISTGQSPSDSEFVDAGPDGRDVFFTTASSLAPQDPGLIDIYDARAGGGYPPPPPPLASCEGEACQGPENPPEDPTPASIGFDGAGNVKAGRGGKPHCAKGKVRRGGHCVAKKHRKRGKQTSTKGRTRG